MVKATTRSTGSTGWGWWKKTTVSDIKQEMAGTTSVFGRDEQLKVSFKGDRAISRRGEIIFPRMPDNAELSDDQVRIMRGWVDSESAMHRYSDLDYLEQQATNGMPEKNPLLYETFKAIESSRCEKRYTDIYFGAGRNLETLTRAIVDRTEVMVEEMKEQPAPPGMKDDPDKMFLPAAISAMMRDKMANTYMWSLMNRLEKHVDLDALKPLITEISNIKTPQEAMQLAKRLLEMEDNKDDEAPAGSGEGHGDEGDGGEGQEGMPQLSEGEGEDSGKEAQPQQGKDQSKSIIDGIANNLFKVTHHHDDENYYEVLTRDYDVVSHWKSPFDVEVPYRLQEDLDNYINTKAKLGNKLNVAKKKLELMIQATMKIEWDRRKERGKFDSKSLVQGYLDDPQVFKTKKDASDLDTAVAICVDNSGSMQGGKTEITNQSIVILSELLNKIGVPFQITGFTDGETHAFKNSDDYRRHRRESRIGNDVYSRVCPIITYEYKRFGDRHFDARKYYNMHNVNMCCNTDGESIEFAAQALLKRPEKRKIMIVLSDGQPAPNEGNTDQVHYHTRRVVKQLDRMIDIVGVGIRDSSVKHYYPEHVVVGDAKNLPETLMDLLGSKLLKGRK